MSKLFTVNKQLMIHIASEVVVLVGITFYFNQKNKKLVAHLEDLAQRVEEQEELLQKHDQMIKQIMEYVNRQHLHHQNKTRTLQGSTKNKPRLKSPPIEKKDSSNERPRTPVRVSFASPEVSPTSKPVESDESDETDDSDLDEELEDELNDLVEDSVDLKKSS